MKACKTKHRLKKNYYCGLKASFLLVFVNNNNNN